MLNIFQSIEQTIQKNGEKNTFNLPAMGAHHVGTVLPAGSGAESSPSNCWSWSTTEGPRASTFCKRRIDLIFDNGTSYSSYSTVCHVCLSILHILTCLVCLTCLIVEQQQSCNHRFAESRSWMFSSRNESLWTQQVIQKVANTSGNRIV